MSERFRALKGLSYPATAKALETVRRAGGISRLAPDARAALAMKRVEAGDACDDVPEESIETLLALGDIERVASDRKRGR